MAVLIADGELLSALLRGLHHGARVRGRLGHGLFAHDVLARVQRVDGHLRVHPVRRQYIHDVNGFVLKKPMIVRVGFRAFRAVLGAGLFGALRNQVAERHDVRAVDGLQGRQVLAIGDSAAADDTNTQSFAHDTLLRNSLTGIYKAYHI
jgi:hypothetical protein